MLVILPAPQGVVSTPQAFLIFSLSIGILLRGA